MLQTLSSAFLAQFQNDEGQALTVVSESIPINDKIEVPFVLDNSVGRKVLTRTQSGTLRTVRPEPNESASKRDTNIFINWESKDIVPSVSLFLPDDQNSEVKEDWVSGDFQTEINFKTSKFGKTVKIRFKRTVRSEYGKWFISVVWQWLVDIIS